MIVSLIAAMAKNRVIGANGDLPWRLPKDFKYFKDKTMGHPIVMGRKTFLSLGKPLPNRENIVLTRNETYRPEGVQVFTEIESAMSYLTSHYADEEVFIIGGEQIYRLAMPFANRIYLTELDRDYQGDANFPEFSLDDFQLSKSDPQEENGVSYHFNVYDRVRS